MYPGVREVQATAEYRLIIAFDNGERRVFDARPLLTVGRFRALAAPEVFSRPRVAFDTVEWEGGPDLDPEYLYERSRPLASAQTPAAEAAPAARRLERP